MPPATDEPSVPARLRDGPVALAPPFRLAGETPLLFWVLLTVLPMLPPPLLPGTRARDGMGRMRPELERLITVDGAFSSTAAPAVVSARLAGGSVNRTFFARTKTPRIGPQEK